MNLISSAAVGPGAFVLLAGAAEAGMTLHGDRTVTHTVTHTVTVTWTAPPKVITKVTTPIRTVTLPRRYRARTSGDHPSRG